MDLGKQEERKKKERKREEEKKKKKRKARYETRRFLSTIPLLFFRCHSRGRLPLRGRHVAAVFKCNAQGLHPWRQENGEEKPKKGGEQEADNEVKERGRKEKRSSAERLRGGARTFGKTGHRSFVRVNASLPRSRKGSSSRAPWYSSRQSIRSVDLALRRETSGINSSPLRYDVRFVYSIYPRIAWLHASSLQIVSSKTSWRTCAFLLGSFKLLRRCGS